MHVLAPSDASVFVVEPAEQSSQETVDAELNWPTKQAVQVVAPTAVNVLVTDPSRHSTHADVDTALY
eukprot:COSAG06_NODE_50571_length_317_cov_26.344037_1_plen_66_part_10